MICGFVPPVKTARSPVLAKPGLNPTNGVTRTNGPQPSSDGRGICAEATAGTTATAATATSQCRFMNILLNRGEWVSSLLLCRGSCKCKEYNEKWGISRRRLGLLPGLRK